MRRRHAAAFAMLFLLTAAATVLRAAEAPAAQPTGGQPAAVPAAQPLPADPKAPVPVRELLRKTYQLSCIDTESCVAVLKQLGYNTTAPTGPTPAAQLPVVFVMAQKSPKSVVGTKTPVSEKVLTEETMSAPENRLMILYTAGQEGEVGKLTDLLEATIDVPGRQVLIEGMLVEVTEGGVKELGITWELFGRDTTKATFLEDGGVTPFVLSYDPEFAPPPDLARRVRAAFRAVIDEGKGDILSSPSVLVLNNRNAKIQVVEDVPILKTIITESTTKVDIDFKTVGIILNIKPRISRDGDTVAMQILVEVSEAPEEDYLRVEDQAVAPLIKRRVVETVARVHDNTPFIIGGLIRNESAEIVSRVPLLSRIPLLGWFFRNTSRRNEKREVIIVLTPRVIETRGTHRPVLPKDSAHLDVLDSLLFRNSYRLKAEDVFDLRFLENNPVLLDAFAGARAYVRRHPEQADRAPFKELAAGIIPGEDAMVIRMIYEVVKSLNLHEQIKAGNLIFFEKDAAKPAGFHVAFLEDVLVRKSGAEDLDAYFERPFPKNVLFLRYRLDSGGGLAGVLHAPSAQVEWLEVKERGEISARLLEINRVGEDGLYHEFALAIASRKDMERLKTAIVLREVAKVNNFEESLTLSRFRVGRLIVIPSLEDSRERIFLTDQYAAELFFKSDYYYASLKDRMEKGYGILEQALRAEERQ